MSHAEEEKLVFPSFAFPECFPEAATSGSAVVSGGEQKKPRQRRRRRARPATSESGGDEAAKKRRLSDDQAQFLELSFKKERKLETPRKVQLAADLGLDTKQVAVWFQNRRARYKSKLMEEEFSKLRAAHDAAVLQNCHLETELLKLKERLAEVEEEKSKLMAAATPTGCGGVSSPSSSSFSTVTNQAALVGQFGVEEETDLSYMSEYAYTNYLMELGAVGYLGVGDYYNQFS